MKRIALISGFIGIVALVAACSGDGDAATTTTAGPSTSAAVTSLSPTDSTTSSTTQPATSVVATTLDPDAPLEFPEYTIVAREEGESGDTVVVLLDEESYASLTDIDLANVLADVVERFPPVLTAYVVDDAAAAEAVVATEPTPEQLELLAHHYLVRLEEGFRMVFAGPFKDSPMTILGS